MKKFMLALLGAFACLSGNAQTFTPPVHIPMILPPASSLDVYGTVKTSSYGYDNVIFQVAPGTFQPQNLHVYSWNAANGVDGGIAWVRRNPANVILDTGYIVVPGSKYCRSVGIVQNSANLTYVIAAYYQTGAAGATPGYKYDMYLWTPTGLGTPVPYDLTSPTTFFPPPPAGPITYRPGGNRISMDCHHLKDVVFVWEEAYSWYGPAAAPILVMNPGKLSTRALTITTTGVPFAADLGAVRTVQGTDRWSKNPDVAFAREGSRARITYMDTDTLLLTGKDIYVRNAPLSTIRTGTGLVPFATDDFLPAATTMFGPSDGDHLNIDCPDNLSGVDPWSIVYNWGPTVIRARTKPVSGPPVTTMLDTFLTEGTNVHPVVAYGREPAVDGINYGWFTNDSYFTGAGAFVNASLNWNGATFHTSTPLGTYRMIDFLPTGGFYQARLAFNRQNDRNTRFKMAYPFMIGLGGGWCDMRSKDIPWGSLSFRPTNINEARLVDVAVQVFPNPFENGFSIMVKNDDGSTQYDVVLTDVQGRTILKSSDNLVHINSQLQNIGNLAAGNYFLSLTSQDGKLNRNIKLNHK